MDSYIEVPTGFLGWGTPRYFRKSDVKVLQENFNSCSASVGSPILIETKEGEVLHGYEPVGW